jgi:hypothetical protein
MTSRLLAAGGAGFVVLTLAGNSLTESVTSAEADRSGARAADDLAAYAGSTSAHLGIGLEVLALVAFVVFAAAASSRMRGAAVPAKLTTAGAVVLVAVKLASGAPLLAGVANHELLTDDTALALVAMNEAAFVLCWVPFAIVVGALATGLRTAGIIGLPTTVAGGLLATLVLVAALVGLGDVNAAMPIPFLLSLVWVAVLSVRLTVNGSEPRTTRSEDDGFAVIPTPTVSQV